MASICPGPNMLTQSSDNKIMSTPLRSQFSMIYGKNISGFWQELSCLMLLDEDFINEKINMSFDIGFVPIIASNPFSNYTDVTLRVFPITGHSNDCLTVCYG